MTADSPLPYRNPQLPIEQRVADLVARLTLEGKIAQMTMLTWLEDVVATHSAEELQHALRHGIGAVTRLGLKRTPRETALAYNQVQRAGQPCVLRKSWLSRRIVSLAEFHGTARLW